MAQTTQVDPTQLKKPIKVGTTLPATCAAGDLFFKTDAAPGSNLYGCSSANTWSVQGGFPSQNCWFNSTAQVLQCENGSGNLFTPVLAATAGTTNQWVDYITIAGTPHTSQPTAAQVRNAVDQTANYSNPTWITALSWSKLTGVPATFNAGQLQGRSVASSAPTDLQYLGWNSSSGQWEPKSMPAGVVSTVFGRSGTVIAQVGDYSAAQVSNAVDQTASYANPVWITALSWSKLTGVPASFNAGQLQGRIVAGTAPTDLQYLGWNNSLGQWEPKTLASGGVSSVFGRLGAITAQAGDYSFAQLSGTLSSSQLPPVAARTDQSNTVTSGTQDFSNAAHTLPMKTGKTANMPSTCSAGETYFATDAAAGNNFYGCASANNWSPETSTYQIASDGVTVGASTTTNFVTGTGLTDTIANTGSQINVQIGLDTAVVQTQSGEQSGTDLLCASTSGSGSAYQCFLKPTASAYTVGMVLHWRPDVNGAGGATTLNVDQLGALPLVLADGVTNPRTGDITGGQLYNVWYDGAGFRLLTGGSVTGGITSVFGRSGAVTAQNGDYNASQITGLAAVAASGSYTDLTNKPTIPAAQVNADWNASSGLAQIFNKPVLATVAASGSYTDLNNKPTIPAAQVNADWNASSGLAQIFNKPALATVATSGSYTDLSNKPSVQSPITTGTTDQLLNGTLGLTSLANCAATGGVLWYSTTTHIFSCHTIAAGDIPALSYLPASNPDLGGTALSNTFMAGSAGVGANFAVQKTTDSPLTYSTASSATASIKGIARATASGGNTFQIVTTGITGCVVKGAVTSGHYWTVDAATGKCIDTGQALRSSICSSVPLGGVFQASGSDGQTVNVSVMPNLTGTQLCSTDLPSNVRARGIGYIFDGGGSALSAGATKYLTVPFACTISRWDLTVDTGTATVDVWKVPSGTTIPTVSNTITASAIPAISSGTATHGTPTGWMTAVSAYDIFGFNLKSVLNATTASLVLECDQ